jgi:phosphomannomutase
MQARCCHTRSVNAHTDWFNAAKQISKLVPDVTIVLHTLYGNPGIEREAEKYGVHVVVGKVGSCNLKEVVDDLFGDEASARTA